MHPSIHQQGHFGLSECDEGDRGHAWLSGAPWGEPPKHTERADGAVLNHPPISYSYHVLLNRLIPTQLPRLQESPPGPRP